MRICDMHCDTLFEIINKNEHLTDHSGHLSLEGLSGYDAFIQVMAMWSENRRTSDENYDAFLLAAGVLERELKYAQERGYKVRLAKSSGDILKNENDGYSSVVFAVEGAKLLDYSISRLEMLYSLGVRVLTLVWAGISPMGGAHDNQEGLSEFGLEVVKQCFELGIIPDVSHANDRQISQVLELAYRYSRPIIASHSNSRTVYTHTRNLTDENYKAIVGLRGVVGVSAACEHLCHENASIDDLVRHIMHYYSIASEGVCLGCDLDGVTRLPNGIENVKDLMLVKQKLLQAGFDEDKTQDIMYNNARGLLIRALGNG